MRRLKNSLLGCSANRNQAALVLAAVLLTSCQRAPRLTDTLGVTPGNQQLGLWGRDVRELAPIVIVGVVEDNRTVAKHIEAARYAGVFLDLHEVSLKLENILRGWAAGPQARFYYFADGRYPDSKPDPVYPGSVQVQRGGRYVFFLTRDREVLRSAGDVAQFPIRVWSGAHTREEIASSDDGKALSKLLLTPGDGADLKIMSDGLVAYRDIADHWGSRPLSVQLLRRLLTLPEPMRSSACGNLAAFYIGQDDCLYAIADDPKESAEHRQVARNELKEKEPGRQPLLEGLKDPAQFGYLNWGGDSYTRYREELETILLGNDALLRERACQALRRYFPWNPEPACSSPPRRIR